MAKKDSNKAQLDLLRDAQSIAKSMGASEENIADLQQEILEKRIKSYDALLTQLKVIQEITTNEKIRAKTLASVEQIESSLSDIIGKMSKDKFKMAQMSKDELDLSKQILKEKEEELKAAKDLAGADLARIASIQAQIKKSKELITRAEQLKEKFGEIDLSLINEGFDTLQDKINSITSFLPKGMSKFLGVDTLGENLKEAALGSEGLSKGLMMTAAVAAIAGAYALLTDITKQAQEFSTQTGLSVAASQKLVEQSIAVQSSFNNQLSSQKDILSVQQQTISQLGTIGKLSGEVALQVSETGKAFGYGAEMAGQVQAQMMQISGMSETAAADAQDFAAQLALAEGIAPGAVMKDIAKSAGVANKYFFGNAKALGKAAVEAQKMGMSLDDMAKTSEALLNIEESLTNQYQLSAMLGRQVNLDKARQLAAEGNIVEATRETIKALGGVQEFERASIFEKERMAAAAGMTVEQLGKSLAIQEKMTNATEEELAAMNGLNLSASEIKNMSAEDLKSKLASQQSTEQLAQSFEKIKSSLTTAILPIAKILMPIFQGLAGLVEGMLAPFQIIGSLLSSFVGYISQLTGGLGEGIEMGAVLATTLKGVGVVLGIMAIKGIISAVAAIYTSLAAIPFGIGIPLAVGAVAALFAAIGSGTSAVQGTMDDGEMSPIGPSGYSRVMTGPQGSIAFNDDDTIVAGTNLGGGGSGTSVIDQSSINAIVGAIQNLRIIIDESAVNAIAQKGAVRASFK